MHLIGDRLVSDKIIWYLAADDFPIIVNYDGMFIDPLYSN